MPGTRALQAKFRVLLVVVSGALAVGADDPESPANKRVKLAEQAYTRLVDQTVEHIYAPQQSAKSEPSDGPLSAEKAEEFYRWSRRWMEAERDRATSKDERIAAIEAHLERMREQEQAIVYKLIFRKHLVHLDGTPLTDQERKEAEERIDSLGKDEIWTKSSFATSMRYFRVEAEAWMAEAKR